MRQARSRTMALAAICGGFLLACGPAEAIAASFGINFSSNYGNWGPHFVNQEGQYESGPYPSAFGVAAADWYEPGNVANTSQLPGSPSSVNFQSASMGAGSVNIAFSSFQGWTGQPGYTGSAYGFANANEYETVDVNPMDGQPDIDPDTGYYVAGPLAATNGVPISGEHAVLSGFLFATAEGEYLNIEDPWPARDIAVTINGLSSIASGYTVKLYAAAQNGHPIEGVQGFTSATVADNASNNELVDFALLPERADYWSPAQALEVDEDPNTFNPYVSVAGLATTSVTFTGDTLTITLSGANEYFNEDAEFFRTTLAGVVIEYDSLVPTLAGDFDNDGDVDGADFVAWQTNFPKATNATRAEGDADGDLDVDGADFAAWQEGFPAASGTSPVPEPTVMVLLLTGGIGLLAGRYRWLRTCR